MKNPNVRCAIIAASAAFALLVLATGAFAQAQFRTDNPQAKVFGAIVFCLDSSNVAQPMPYCDNYLNIAANGTTTVKSGKGFLRSITINSKGASANTATVYDNTAGSGTKIATIDTTTGGVFTYDLEFITGLTVVLATGTSADITVSYK